MMATPVCSHTSSIVCLLVTLREGGQGMRVLQEGENVCGALEICAKTCRQ